MKKLLALIASCLLLFTGCSALGTMREDNASSSLSKIIEIVDFPSEYSSKDAESSKPSQSSADSSAPDSSEDESSIPDSSEVESSEPDNGDPGETPPAHTHSHKATVTAPTCTAAGYTTYTCSCGDSYTANEVKALGHSEETVQGKAATCTENGLSNGVKCSVCGITITAQKVLTATGHKLASKVTLPTCTAVGYTTYTCSICGDGYESDEVAALGHAWLAATTEAPKTCSTCGATEGDKLPTVTPDPTPSAMPTLSVNYINVGQGDSILIKVDDCDILIDGGKSGSGSTVSSYLKSKNVDDIELMINTHPDEDHYGGLTTVLNDFKVENFWGSSFSKSTSSYTTFKTAINKEGLSFKTPSVGSVYTYNYLTISVLYAGASASNSNDSSIVVMIQYGSVRFLCTGDISSSIESKLVSSSNLSCDVLKVPHHGSAGSSSSSFLKATGARYGVICVGNNSYGHPTSTALNNLSSAGISVYRTDTYGHVVFSTNGTSLTLPGGSSVSGNSGSGSSSNGSYSNNDNFIGNKESKIFHLPTCSHLPAESKRNYLYDYWFIVNCIGYTPCQICLKNYVP